MENQNFGSTGDQNNYTTETGKKGLGGTGILLLVTTVVFLGASIFLFADNSNKAKATKALTTELSSSEKRYTDLDARYTSALAEIESYKGRNATLDSMLSTREKSILSLKSNLSKEKKNRQLGEAEYQKQLTDLNSMISDLSVQVAELQKQNTTLTAQKDSLGQDIVVKVGTISTLETTNTSLTQKVTVASLLMPSNIEMTATRDKSSGKESETNRADKAQHLKVCFDIPENKVAEAGTKSFLVRIVSPEGAVMAVESAGSGTFTSVENGSQMQYSTTANVEYQNVAKAGICSMWNQTTPFQKGTYKAEIYQDGYLIGTKSLELK